jgi:lipopolysaccharide biosynthesis glycosyltransferase
MGSAQKKTIGVGFDDNYLYPFLLLAYSISQNSQSLPKICIANVNGTLSKESCQILEKFNSFLDLEIEIFEASVPSNVRTSSRVSIAAYGRLWLADNLSENFVYIDTDSLVLPGWEEIFDYADLLDQNRELLVGAMPALENQTPPWPINFGDTTQYRFHSSILVINHQNWTEHFSNSENLPWQKIASMHEELQFVGHDQPVLQYAAQGKYLHLPPDFVNFATKYTQTTKVVTSGVWKKPWTVSREQFFKYISSLMMYQEYEQVFGVIKELDIYSKYEDEMLKYLEGNVDLKREIVAVKQAVQTNFSFRENLPFTISKLLFDLMTKGRKLLNKLKF